MNENIIFFLIYLFIVLVFVLTCAIVVVSILKTLKKLFIKIFSRDDREFDPLGEKIKIAKRKRFFATTPGEVEEQKKEPVFVPKSKPLGELGGYVNTSHKDEVKVEKNIVIEQRATEAKNIAEGLNQIKKLASEKEEPPKPIELPNKEERGIEKNIPEANSVPEVKSTPEIGSIPEAIEAPIKGKLFTKTTEPTSSGHIKPVYVPRNQSLGNTGGYIITSHKEDEEDGKDEEDIVKEQRAKKEKDIASGLDFLKKSSSDEEEPSKLAGLPSRDKKDENSDIYEAIRIPKRRRFFDKKSDGKVSVSAPSNKAFGNTGGYVSATHKQEVKVEKDIVKDQRAIEAKNIAEGLNQLKKSQSTEKTVAQGVNQKKEEASMGGRIEYLKAELSKESLNKDPDIEKRIKTQGKFRDNGFIKWIAKIIKREKIAKNEAERIKKETVVISSDLHDTSLFYDKEKIEAAQKTMRGRNRGWASSLFGGGPGSGEKPINRDVPFGDSTLNTQKSGSIFGGKSSASKQAAAAQKDDTIFGGKSEISRVKLKHELRFNTKIWEAERQAGLTLSPIERSKLEKEVFSQALGRNISKSDIKWGVRKLNQKMLSTKDLAEKGKLRKEVKFFKKIGGIK